MVVDLAYLMQDYIKEKSAIKLITLNRILFDKKQHEELRLTSHYLLLSYFLFPPKKVLKNVVKMLIICNLVI